MSAPAGVIARCCYRCDAEFPTGSADERVYCPECVRRWAFPALSVPFPVARPVRVAAASRSRRQITASVSQRTTCEVCGRKVQSGKRFCSEDCSTQLPLFSARPDNAVGVGGMRHEHAIVLPGELCTCGRPAVQVFVSESGREVGYCGLPDGGSGPVLVRSAVPPRNTSARGAIRRRARTTGPSRGASVTAGEWLGRCGVCSAELHLDDAGGRWIRAGPGTARRPVPRPSPRKR